MKRILVLILTVAVFAGAFFLLNANPTALVLPEDISAEEINLLYVGEERLEIFFSETQHFFEESFFVEIFSNNPNAEIHYTLCGAFPTSDSDIYSEPIEIVPARRQMAVVLRAIAIYEEEISEPLTHTFFVREEIDERFDVLIFSLSTDRDHLYDFDTGILIEGATRRDFIRENPHENIRPTSPANFNWRGREGERPMHVEVFTADGTRVIAQEAGARVFGSWSRAENVKSLRLIARREYSHDTGRFHYPFFPGEVVQDGFGTPIVSYNELILRNGGNDRQHGILRNELGSVLLRRAGVMDVTPVRAAAMFINGNYYGHMWLQVRSFEHFFQDLYGAPTRDFDVIGRGEWWFRNATEAQEEALTYKNNFADEDLTDDATFARLEAIVDVENLLFYYAYQIFLGNGDWPHNNLRRWRYTGEPFEGMPEELDGRWRYAYFDLDQTFGLFNQNYRRNTFQMVLERDNDNGQLIRAILQRQDMAELFTMIFCDIAANVVNEDIVAEVLNALYDEIDNELSHALRASLLNGWVSRNSIENYHASTLAFAERRHIYIFERLVSYFDLEDEMFDVRVTGGEAIIGTQRGVSSRYFAHLTIPVTPSLPEFTVFDHWVLNGERIFTEKIYVIAADATDGVVHLQLVTRREVPPLMIHEIVITPQGNGITLINVSENTLRTDTFYLSNTRDDLRRFRLPAATLAPGATLELAGRSSRIPGHFFRVQLDFNIRENRRVFLSDENGNIIGTVLP
jgi:hypothetical protein